MNRDFARESSQVHVRPVQALGEGQKSEFAGCAAFPGIAVSNSALSSALATQSVRRMGRLRLVMSRQLNRAFNCAINESHG